MPSALFLIHPSTPLSLDFEGTFVAYTDKEHNYRQITYKAVGKFTEEGVVVV